MGTHEEPYEATILADALHYNFALKVVVPSSRFFVRRSILQMDGDSHDSYGRE